MINRTLLLAVLMTLSTTAAAEIVVVGPADGGVDRLTRADVQQLFSGKKQQVDGVHLKPMDLPPDNPTRTSFYEKVLDKSPSQMRSHWARLTFTGKGKPPEIVSGPQELNALLSRRDGHYLGYVEAGQVTDSMSVLYRVD